jgi:hypothetical protein
MKTHMQPTSHVVWWNSIWKLAECASEQILVYLGDLCRYGD